MNHLPSPMSSWAEFLKTCPQDPLIILGIDPGTTTVGFCAMAIDPITIERLHYEAFTVNTERPCGGRFVDDDLAETKSSVFVRLQELRMRFLGILQHYRPLQTTTELPFFNRLHPNAFGPLIQVLSILELTMYEWNPHKPLYRVENTVAKALIYPTNKEERKEIQAIKGSKDRILECLRRHPDFQWIATDVLDEHSIDATLIAECQRRRLLQSDFEVRY